MTQEPVIVAKDLRKNYNEFEAVKGINFEVQPQECFGILGPNGAGKSSTIRMLHCFSPITSGTLTVLGYSVTTHSRQIKAVLGVVPQEDNLDGDLGVEDNLLVYARYFGIDKAEARRRSDEVLELFQLSDKRKSRVNELSGGMKRRLVIARSLINKPKVIILDEPTTGLDPAARQLVWQKLRYLRDEGGVTLVLTTHYMEEAAQLCNRLVVMNEGVILAEGMPNELVQRLVGYDVMELRIGEAEGQTLLAELQNRPIMSERAGDTLFLFGKEPNAFNTITFPDVAYRLQRKASLEDVFLRLTGRGLTE